MNARENRLAGMTPLLTLVGDSILVALAIAAALSSAASFGTLLSLRF